MKGADYKSQKSKSTPHFFAYYGAPGSFTHQAALNYAQKNAGENVELISCETLDQLFKTLV